MAKNQSQRKETTKLNKSKSEFEKLLQKRIIAGEELLKMEVQNTEDFSELKIKYNSWNDYNLELLKQCFNNADNEYRHQYNQAGLLSMAIISSNRMNSFQQDLKNSVEKIKIKIKNLKNLEQKLELIPSLIEDETENETINVEFSKSKVFIVHGHDELAKSEVARFVEKLGLEAIILHEQASGGRTIIEKIEQYSNVGFGIVLYTQCDVGAAKDNSDNLKSRARQNVVFEHGYLIGKLGRKNVSAIVNGDIETPNDISGVVYISMSSDWKMELAKEMKISGYNIDLNKVFL